MSAKQRKKNNKKNDKISKEKPVSFTRKLLSIGIKMASFAFGVVFLLFLFVYLGVFGPLPSQQELSEINNNIASEVFASDGSLMGKYYYQNRMSVENETISKHAVNALIATEDSRFFEHKGFDVISLGRVLFRTILMGDVRQGGGSTISQQLAKNLYPRQSYGPFSMLINKSKEIFVASRLEKVYTKDDILRLYLNTVPFGEDVYGIEAAAQRFYSKHSANLAPNEAAVLIGMLAANTAYNPRLNPEKSLNRRNIVLGRMADQNFISQQEFEKYKSMSLNLHYRRIDHNTGVAPYFREQVKKEVEEILFDKYGDHYNIYTDGLRIYTTIDPVLQKYADEAVQTHMAQLQNEFKHHWLNKEPWKNHPEVFNRELRRSKRYKQLKAEGKSDDEIVKQMSQLERMTVFAYPTEKEVNLSPMDSIRHYLKILNTGFMVMDPHSGRILAWVGGVSHKYFQYDHVTSRRQVGSTFKPIVYTEALLQGIQPCEFFSNERRVYSEYDDWSPANADGMHDGYYSMKGGLTNSVNTITAQLMIKSGVDEVLNLAEEMGVQSKLPAVPSVCLGTGEISLEDMLTVYSCYANEGRKSSPVGLMRIEDSKGNVLYQYEAKNKGEQVLDEETVRMMNYMLNGVVENGTGKGLRNTYHLKSDLAGKTGTTQNNADGWFIGYTPNLLAGAWVGASSPKVHFRTTTLGQGAHMALPIFALFMKKVEADARYGQLIKTQFSSLSPDELAMVDCADFSEEDPDKSMFDFLFSKNKQKDKELLREEKMKDKQALKDDDERKERRKSFLGKMKDLFKKKE